MQPKMQTERFTRNRVESSTNSRDFESREDPRGSERKKQKPYESDNFKEMLSNNNNLTSPTSMVSNSNHRRDNSGYVEETPAFQRSNDNEFSEIMLRNSRVVQSNKKPKHQNRTEQISRNDMGSNEFTLMDAFTPSGLER